MTYDRRRRFAWTLGFAVVGFLAASAYSGSHYGVCTSGSHACVALDGAVGNAAIETCSDERAWSAPAPCALGVCQSTGSDVACGAECRPGTQVCGGDDGRLVGVCSPHGTLPRTFAPCKRPGETCRTNAIGRSLGCWPLLELASADAGRSRY